MVRIRVMVRVRMRVVYINGFVFVTYTALFTV